MDLILRPNPRLEEYVLWNCDTDLPTFIGDPDELVVRLREGVADEPCARCRDRWEYDMRRAIGRADRFGTASLAVIGDDLHHPLDEAAARGYGAYGGHLIFAGIGTVETAQVGHLTSLFLGEAKGDPESPLLADLVRPMISLDLDEPPESVAS